MKRFLPQLLLVFTLCFTALGYANATIVQEMDTPELVQNSDYILTGRVLSVKYKWNANHTRIITETTASIELAIKGAPTPTITIQTLGGTIDGITQHVSGEPSFSVGEKILVFLENDNAVLRPVAMSLGKFSIITKNNVEYAVSNPRGLALLRQTNTSGNAHQMRDAKPQNIPLDLFLNEINGFVNSSY